mgnify:FL=1
MQTVQADLISGKKVLLRFDIDVPLRQAQGHGQFEVVDDFRLKAGLPTLKLCLENATEVILMGHIGRPNGIDQSLSVAPIYYWFCNQGFEENFKSGKLRILENLRFEPGEDGCDADYTKELASLGDFYINEAFAAYHKASSTTLLPTLLPHAAGLCFASEVEKLLEVRENPKRPFIAIIGGVKIEDKIPVINVLAEKASAVLVGGKLAQIIHEESFNFPHNVFAGHLSQDGFDISLQTVKAWEPLIKGAKMIVWNGPVGKVEDSRYSKGTMDIAKIILRSEADVIIGGGDTVGFLQNAGFLSQFEAKGFVSTGGGAMLKFLTDGTLATIEALK